MRIRRRVSQLSIPIVLALATGCASGGSATAASAEDRDRVSAEELSTVFVSDLYQALQRLRPLWLQSRGPRAVNQETQIAVVVNGTYFGPVETLSQISTQSVVEIRRLDGPTASATIPGILGSGRNIESAIVVRLGAPND